MNFNERVYEIVRRVPKGKVISYGQVAFLAGSPRGARAVGWALHRNPYPWVMGGENPVPCHRVVGSTGALVGYAGGLGVKTHLLNLEKAHED